MVDVPPPEMGAPAELLSQRKEEKYNYKELCRMRISACSTLYKSLEPGVKVALDDDPRASTCMEQGLLERYGYF